MGLPVAALVIGGIGSAVSAIGAIGAGQAQAQAASYQAQVAQNNAKIAAQNAEYAIQSGNEKAQIESLRAGERTAAVRAAIAANGLDVNTGSAADVQIAQTESGELNTQQTAQQAQLTAYGYRTQVTNYEAQAGLLKQQAGYDATAGLITGAGDLLSGGSSLGLKAAQLQLSGGL